MDGQLLRFVKGDRIGRNGPVQPDIAAHDGAISYDRIAADNGRVRVDRDVIADGGMPLAAEGVALLIAFDVLSEAARDQPDALIKTHAIADFGRASNHHAGAMIDEEMGADFRAGMQIDAGAAVRPFGHHPGEKGNIRFVENMGHAKDSDRLDAGISKHDLLLARRGGIALKGSLDVGLDQATDIGQFPEKFERDALRVRARDGMHLQALRDLSRQPLLQAAELQCRLMRQVLHRNLVLGNKAGENDVEQILGQRGHGIFRGQARAIEMLNPAAMGV